MNLVNVSQNQNIDSADKLVLVSVSLFFPMVNLGDVISILWSLFKSSFSQDRRYAQYALWATPSFLKSLENKKAVM